MAAGAGAHPGGAQGNLVLGEVADLRCARIPATAEQLPRIRHALAAWAQRVGLSDDCVEVIVLAAYEAMANVVTHAYPRNGGGREEGSFDVHAVYRPGQGQLRITVADRGRWCDQRSQASNGWGLQLISALAGRTSVDRRADGTTIEMSWPADRLADGAG